MGEVSKTLYPQGVLKYAPRETLAIIEFHRFRRPKNNRRKELPHVAERLFSSTSIAKFLQHAVRIIACEALAEISSKSQLVAFASNRMLAIVEICYSDCNYHSDSEEEKK